MECRLSEFVFDVPPTPSCHASTLLRRRNGGFVCAWFAGTRESDSDVTVYSAIRGEAGWSQPRQITVSTGEAQWNPVLFRMGERIALFYKQGNPPIAQWRTMVQYSTDEGETWGEAAELVPGDDSGGRGPVKDKPIRLSNGWVCAGGSTERGSWRPFADLSRDGGRTWEKRPIPVADESVNLIQPSIWEYPAGYVHALLRSDRGCIYRADSEDFGESWSRARPTEIPNNNSGIDLTELVDGRIALLCNPVGENRGKRSPLSLFVSENHGETFRRVLDVEAAEDGELSYPAVIADGSCIFFTYTWKRTHIRFGSIAL